MSALYLVLAEQQMCLKKQFSFFFIYLREEEKRKRKRLKRVGRSECALALLQANADMNPRLILPQEIVVAGGLFFFIL